MAWGGFQQLRSFSPSQEAPNTMGGGRRGRAEPRRPSPIPRLEGHTPPQPLRCVGAPSPTPLQLFWSLGCQPLAAGSTCLLPPSAHAPRDAHPPPTQPLLEAPPSHLPSWGGAETPIRREDAGPGKRAE